MINTIINGDCLKILRTLNDNSVDCIITSPPYNLMALRGRVKVSNHTTKNVNIEYDNYDDNMPEYLYQQWQIDIINELIRILKPTGSLFYNHKMRRWGGQLYNPWDFLSKTHGQLHQLIIWDRGRSPNVRKDYCLPTTEHIYWFRKDKPKVYKKQAQFTQEVWHIPPSRNTDHPATFPEQLVENCLNLTTEQHDIVLDPFVGIGTVPIMAKRMGRQYIGIEISKRYCDIAEHRLNNANN